MKWLQTFLNAPRSLTPHPSEETVPFWMLLPYRAYEGGLFTGEKCVGFVLETSPLVGSSEVMQRELSGLFRHTLMEGLSLQVSLYADPRIGGILSRWENAREGDIFQTLAHNRTSFLKQRAFGEKPTGPLRDFRCIVSVSKAIKDEILSPIERDQMLRLKEQVRVALETLNLPVMAWEATHLIQSLEGILNFDGGVEPSPLTWNPYDPLHHQMTRAGGGYRITPEGIEVNESHLIRSYGVRRAPDLWSLHAMGELIGDPLRDLLQIPCPFMIHYGVMIPPQGETARRVQSRETWVENQACSQIGKRIPLLVRQARELALVREQQGQGERFVQTRMTLLLLMKKDGIDGAQQTLLGLFRSKGWELTPERYLHLPNLLSSLPMAWSSGIVQDLSTLQRMKTTLSSEAANLLPLQGEWKGTSSPGLLLSSRRGQLLTWSPFDNREGNYNVAVVGKSGSGKSVLMQEIALSTLGIGGRVFVLDVGRSFERTAKLLGGTYLSFTPHTHLSLNPFTSLPKDPREAEDALGLLKPILSLMASPKDGTNDLENALLEEALQHVWQNSGQAGDISQIATFLTQHPNPTAQTLGQKLFPYTKRGIYGRFFEGPATIDLSSSFVVVELEELKERKDLQEVILQMVIVQITNSLYLGDRTTPSHIILDEAWDMLRGQQSGTFVETAARRLRKYRGSLIVGTQSVNDFYATPAAQAAFENADFMALLSQKPESIKQLKASKRIHMDPTMEGLLTSLRTQQGRYAEILITGPHGYAVTRLILDPFSSVLTSTKPEEFTAVQAFLNQGYSLTEAIEQVARGRN